MSCKGAGKESIFRDSSLSVPGEQKMASESNKLKIARIHETYSELSKENIAKVLQYYDDDEHEALNAIGRDGGREALKNWADSMSSKSKNNKNKKKKKKNKKDASLGSSATASFDADDSSSSLHSCGNIDGDIEKDVLLAEGNNDPLLDDADGGKHPVDERLKSEVADSSVTPEVAPSASTVSCEPSPAKSSVVEVPKRGGQGKSNPAPASPTSESFDRHDESKSDKYRSVKEEGKPQRQRTNSSRRSKTTSFSEDTSNQYNPQAIAAPTKRGFEKCKKDLHKQNIYLQRIHSQVEKGLEDSSKKLDKVFNDLRKLLDQRQLKLESELAKSKEEALNLLKSRQDMAIELKRRVDRTPSLTEAEWAELRTDIKQFVTERKYDDELGKTIWFQWSEEITEQIESFGEVSPVKNVYSQRSHSAMSNAPASQNHPEPSPSSSLANEDISSAIDKNDAADILAAEEAKSANKDTNPSVPRNPPPENRSRVFSNTKYHTNRDNRSRGGYRGNKGYQRYPRSSNQNSFRNSNYHSYDSNYDSRNYQDRENRYHSNNAYTNDRNMNPNRNSYRNERTGQNVDFRSRQGGRGRGNMGHPHQINHSTRPEAAPKENSSTVSSEQANAVNGYVKTD